MASEAGTPCTYDGNGNLVQVGDPSTTGGIIYSYDDENRLIEVYTNYNVPSGPLIAGTTAWRSDFIYDGLGRLRKRVEYVNEVLNSTTLYIYDGARVIQERDGNNNPLVSYTRGADLSGSLEGAGGIGGLLARSSGYSGGNWTTHYFYHADGQGNVTCLTDTNQTAVANYRYDPFGNTISSSGSLSALNMYRFSSKEVHRNTGMYYFGARFYDPNLQRFINRDPIGEAGGLNLYGFCGNSPLDGFDPTGLCKKKKSALREVLENLPHNLWHALDWIPDLIYTVPAEIGSVIDQQNKLSDEGYCGWQDYNMQNSDDPNYVATAGDTDWIGPMADLESDVVQAYVMVESALAGCATAPEMDMAIGAESSTETAVAESAVEADAVGSATGIGGAARDCVAQVGDYLSATLGQEPTSINGLYDTVNQNTVGTWQQATSLIEQNTGLTSGNPVGWQNAGPGHYAVFTDTHAVYGYVPPENPNIGSYIYDPQIATVHPANSPQFQNAVAVPFTKR